jgi:hypothetical protein
MALTPMSNISPIHSGKPEDFWNLRPGLPGLLDFLRIVTALVGYILSGLGWIFFAFSLAVAPPAARRFYHDLMYLIVPGWLLLRLAAGLFPFGRRWFPWQNPAGAGPG